MTIELVRKLPYDHPYRWDGRKFGGFELWTPAETTTTLWYDAYDLDNCTLVSTKYSVVNDKSGNGKHLGQTTDSQRPTSGTINGFQGMAFTAANDTRIHTGATDVTLGDDDVNIFMAASMSSSAETNGRMISFYDNSQTYDYQNDGSFGISRSGATQALSTINDGNQDLVSITYDTPFVATTIFDSTGFEMSINGTPSGSPSATPNTLGSNGQFVIGTGSTKGGSPNEEGDVYWQGVIGEVIVVTGAISAALQAQFEGYLAWKFGTEGSLAAGHTYKSAPPKVS